MPARLNKKHREPPLFVPQDLWGELLESISRQHRGWLVELETHDLVTGERVVSSEMPLEAIELDLEDQKNPRINVIVDCDRKVIKQILFLPSRLMVLGPSEDPREQTLRVETLNTETTIHVRPPASLSSD